ncbi:MAG: class I SAM-dependent methyltransferase [Armatimonadota bacterium]|jgi:SAM-dependent methyltransferase
MAWYEELFSKEDPARYDIYEASEVSRSQVDFVIDALSLQPGARLLDLCCGQGRHLIELAKRGYDVVGLDLSEYMLDKCRAAAAEQGVEPVLVHADMREIGFTEEFDAVINMYTSFGYLENPDEDQKALNAASLALRGGGLFLIDLMNRDWLLNDFESVVWQENPRGDLILADRHFDSLTGRLNARELTIYCDGHREENVNSIRLYTFNELEAMLLKAGLMVQSVYGDYDASVFEAASRRMIVVSKAEKDT